ncbi:hypothetical protein EEB14_35540 [Rhodococcus sp. WS4]|nr:hypothetical protein EEB14_35540 [Rhodococcus sp. WS4]
MARKGLPTGFLSLVYSHVTVRTDPQAPGITEFVGLCFCTVHWRNLTTGAAATVIPTWMANPVITGSGTLVAALTLNGLPHIPGTVTAILGAGTWNLP